VLLHRSFISIFRPYPNFPTVAMDSVAAATLWKKRWATAYQWDSLVRCKEFRKSATLQVYDTGSNTKLYQYDDPGGLNYCAHCASGQRYECLFFHPTITDIYLDIIKEMGRTKLGTLKLTNLDLLDRVFRLLPAHFTLLGFPCQLGGIWRCVVDKLDQTFPVGDLLMLNIPSFIQGFQHVPTFDIYECCNDSSSDDSGSVSAEDEDVVLVTTQATGDNKKVVNLNPATHQKTISGAVKKKQVLSFKNPYLRK
jgi:hypothetical protein